MMVKRQLRVIFLLIVRVVHPRFWSISPVMVTRSALSFVGCPSLHNSAGLAQVYFFERPVLPDRDGQQLPMNAIIKLRQYAEYWCAGVAFA